MTTYPEEYNFTKRPRTTTFEYIQTEFDPEW